MQGPAGQDPWGLTESRLKCRELGSTAVGVAQPRSGRVAIFAPPVLRPPEFCLSNRDGVAEAQARTVPWGYMVEQSARETELSCVPFCHLPAVGPWQTDPPSRILAAASENRDHNGTLLTGVSEDPKYDSAHIIVKGLAHGNTQYVLAIIVVVISLSPLSRTFCQLKAHTDKWYPGLV